MSADILILGGGPAGLSTALHLARAAPELIPRVLVLEKSRYPRRKLCGGALTPDAEVLLRNLDLDVSELPHVDAAAVHLDFAGRGLTMKLRGAHALRMIQRDEFDAWLATKARQAGIAIQEGATARRVVVGAGRASVETEDGVLDATVVVGADGSNGVVRRSILPDAPIHTARALELLIPPGESGEHNQGARASTSAHAPDVAYFDFAPVPKGIAGYTWDFPTQVRGQPMRCWGIYDTNLLADRVRPPLKRALAEEMGRHGADLAQTELAGHPIRWFSPFSSLSVPHVILVGDAAGVDGIFGEGISVALGYGQIAADAIRQAIQQDNFSFSDYRRRVLCSPLGRALVVRSAITRALYRLHWRWFQRMFWQVLKPLVALGSYFLVMNWATRMRSRGRRPHRSPAGEASA